MSKHKSIKLKSDSSFGHVNHDSEVVFEVDKEGQHPLAISHCGAVMFFDKDQYKRLVDFVNNNRPKVD